MKECNDTIDIIEDQLQTKEAKEKYLEIMSTRLDESKKIMNKTLIWMLIVVIAFILISLSKIDNVSVSVFGKIDKHTILLISPSLFALMYYYYILTWMHFLQQKKIYAHLTGLLFKIDVESHLNDHIQPFNLMEVITKHHDSDNKNSTGCLTSIILIPMLAFIAFFPILFIWFSITSNQNTLNLELKGSVLSLLLPIIIAILLLLMLIKSIRINVFGRE